MAAAVWSHGMARRYSPSEWDQWAAFQEWRRRTPADTAPAMPEEPPVQESLPHAVARDWERRTSSSGHVFRVHLETGHTQFERPPASLRYEELNRLLVLGVR